MSCNATISFIDATCFIESGEASKYWDFRQNRVEFLDKMCNVQFIDKVMIGTVIIN